MMFAVFEHSCSEGHIAGQRGHNAEFLLVRILGTIVPTSYEKNYSFCYKVITVRKLICPTVDRLLYIAKSLFVCVHHVDMWRGNGMGKTRTNAYRLDLVQKTQTCWSKANTILRHFCLFY